MNPVKIVLFLSFIATPCRAAVSILVQPGSTSEKTFFTVTQTSPSPLLEVSGLPGYALAVSIPTAIFNIPDFGEGSSSDIHGGLGASIATIRESISGQTFSVTGLLVSANPSLASMLGFDHLFTFPTGFSSVRFEVESAGAIETNIPIYVLNPGVYSIEDTLFGTVTVTVVPEPSGTALLASGMALLAARRRRTA